ncbi:MAG TPA: 16S rRNA (cytosine(967)-C(5))-methyltransferase RsmB [Terriglobales bacterium]|nr:16S rRNA (cytosine(967)-C(5))-methyltransferase RsmB [Terriglobales bacterium]
MAVSPARLAAYEILLRVERGGAYATDLLHSSLLSRFSEADKALTTELVMGVLRWRARLDHLLAAACSQPLAKLDLEVLTALRLGAYQLGFLERVPARAAVHESVELAKRAKKRSAAPLVNAVLRRLAGQRNVFHVEHPGDEASAREMADRYSHPLWLVERWAENFGTSAAARICEFDQSVPATALRLSADVTDDQLHREGIEGAPGAVLKRARRVASGDVTKSQAFAAGRVAIQDEASQLVAAMVGTGVRILDCCAAPGGKTAAIAERNPQAMIVAAELHPHRARTLRRRACAGNVRVLAADALALPLDLQFDRVLADVPCSGTGTLARNPEIKWRLAQGDLADLHRKQVAILRAALDRVAPGGRLIYSTCSLEPEENAEVVSEALSSRSDVRLLDCREELQRLKDTEELAWNDVDSLAAGRFLQTLPGVHPCDGFFAAILERKPGA